MTRGPAVLLIGCAIGVLACGARTHDPTSPGAPGGRPEWVPAYSAEQEALLVPGADPVRLRAERVLPNLDTFVYSDDLVLGDPREAVRVTQLVAEAFQHTQRSYDLAEAGAELANAVVQYGPRGDLEPNPYKVAFVDPRGRAHMVLEDLSSDAKDAMSDGQRAEKAGHFGDAEAAFAKAVAVAPDVPAVHLALASVLVRRSPALAEAELRKTAHLDPTLAVTHSELAKLLLGRGDVSGARIEIAHALAYWPTSEVTMAIARELPRATTPPAPGRTRVAPYRIFLDVDAAGAVRVAAPASPGPRMYGGCRALLRYEPDMRAELFGVPRDEPYFLSAEEEMICVEAGIGAMIVDRDTPAVAGDHAVPFAAPTTLDPSDALLRMAHTEGLLGYVMFEIIGQARPDIARMAPASTHRAMVTYIEHHVLAFDELATTNDDVASR